MDKALKREELLQKAKSIKEFDIAIIGGGASGLGVAFEAVSRGLNIICIEQEDFGSGTSSKSTKLLHGGVRYLAKGQVRLVSEALKERTTILTLAPHISSTLSFIIPIYSYLDAIIYFLGLKLYDFLSGNKSIGKSRWMSKKDIKNSLPNLNINGLLGGIEYFDGQFDDSRMCIDLVNTINNQNGICLNYCSFKEFITATNNFEGIIVHDHISNNDFTIKAKAIVNASGVFFDDIMQHQGFSYPFKIVPSRGTHITLDNSFLKSESAIMIPKTSDGRVLFIIPWKDKVIVGTTDELTKDKTLHPKALVKDIDFILQNAGKYLQKKPTKKDILSSFAGLRPLASYKNNKEKTKEISRSHKILRTGNNLFSIIGGKWTSFRKMGYDTIEKITKYNLIPKKESHSQSLTIQKPNHPTNKPLIHPNLPYTWDQLAYIIENELVESSTDLLARRTRCLFLDKQATISILDETIALLARVKVKDDIWESKDKKRFHIFAKTF